MLEAKVKFFDIKKCGFYLRGNDQTQFSGISEILQKLNQWARDGRPVLTAVDILLGVS